MCFLEATGVVAGKAGPTREPCCLRGTGPLNALEVPSCAGGDSGWQRGRDRISCGERNGVPLLARRPFGCWACCLAAGVGHTGIRPAPPRGGTESERGKAPGGHPTCTQRKGRLANTPTRKRAVSALQGFFV